MAGSVNKVTILAEEYLGGYSICDLSKRHGIAISTIRFRLKKLGILRSRAEAIRLCAASGKLRERRKRAYQPLSGEARQRISDARSKWADAHAVGICHKANGYVEYTRGENKGRSVHVVLMEQRLGRRILPDEVVHHIDGIRSNNHIDNLALMTRKAHSRLHRFEDELAGKVRERDQNGRLR